MNLLKEITVRAKWDGSFTEDWGTLRSFISQGGLSDVPGERDILKLKAWAEGEGLSMDFEMDDGGFSSTIRSITFRKEGQESSPANPAELSAEDTPAAHPSGDDPVYTDPAQTEAAEDYFDCETVDCR